VSQGRGYGRDRLGRGEDWHRLLAVLMVGTLGASATVDAKIQQASDGSGTGAKDLTTAKSITQLTQAGTDANKQVLINVRPDDLDLDNNFTHIRLSVTVATAACLIAALVLGFNARFGSASDNDAATVERDRGVSRLYRRV
jgi:hypothetical protein